MRGRIEHDEGVIVVDTGETAQVHVRGYHPSWHPFYRRAVRFSVHPDEEIGPRLRALGISPRDVTPCCADSSSYRSRRRLGTPDGKQNLGGEAGVRARARMGRAHSGLSAASLAKVVATGMDSVCVEDRWPIQTEYGVDESRRRADCPHAGTHPASCVRHRARLALLSFSPVIPATTSSFCWTKRAME